MGSNTVTIIDNTTGKEIELPVHEGSDGPAVIDVQALYKHLGKFTYDPGFVSTASCRSSITYLDGDAGILRYRGYPIEQLAQNSSYLEVSYLLLYGELPTKQELENYQSVLREHSMVHEGVRRFYSGFHHDAHPMAIMVGVVGALSGFYHDSLNVHDKVEREHAAHRLVAKMPTIAADACKYTMGQPFMYPDNTLGYVQNFMRMMFGVPTEKFEVNETMANALELILILHADHEQNASTSTVRIASSSHANIYACVSAGIASLWGPAHGGANEAVIRMLEEIKDPKQIPSYVARAKDKSDPYRLMGFGHRVYKNFDPRAKLIREACHKLLDDLGAHNQVLFETALELERIALEDDYFKQRKLYPNVDFYSGIILKAMGIPLDMFTVIFTLARTTGWLAQWMEQMDDAQQRIGRPRQLYVGAPKRDYIPIAKRK